MHHFGLGFAQGTRAPAQEHSLAQAMYLGAVVVDGEDVGTEHSGQEVMRDAWGEVGRVGDGKRPAGMDSGAASHNYGGLGLVEYGSGSTYSQHPLAGQKRWGLCWLAYSYCWVLLMLTKVRVEGSCYSQQQEVVVWDTNKTGYEKGYLVKKGLVVEVAEVAEADTDCR